MAAILRPDDVIRGHVEALVYIVWMYFRWIRLTQVQH